MKTGFEGWDFTLKAIGDDVSREGRLRAKMCTEVCPRSESNCLCISAHSSRNVRWTGGVSLDPSASYPFRSAGSKSCGFSLSNPPLFHAYSLSPHSSSCKQHLPGRPPFLLGGLRSALHTSTRANLGKENPPLPCASQMPFTVACGQQGRAQIPHHSLGSTIR